MKPGKDTKKKGKVAPANPSVKDTKLAPLPLTSASKANLAPQGSSPVFDFILGSIHEFLLKNGFQDTLDCFQQEQFVLPSNGKQPTPSYDGLLLEVKPPF